MSYRRRLLGQPQPDPPLAALGGLQLMRADRAASIHAAGDRVLGHGRRVLLHMGLAGAGAWHVSDAAAVKPSIHPTTGSRVAARTPGVPLTPGHFLMMQVVAEPSGQTAIVAADTLYKTGIVGAVEVAVVFTNSGGSVTITKRIDIPGSGLANGAQPTGSGAAWAALYRRRTSMIMPANLNLPATLAAWCEGVTVSMTLSVIGAPRVIHAIVYEVPYCYAGDKAAGNWILPLHSDAAGNALPSLPGERPVERRLPLDDLGSGTEILADSAKRLREVGPVLWYATAWCESTQAFAATETTARTVTGTTATELIEGSTTAWSSSSAGASLASGANARRVEDSEAVAVLGDYDNVVPVQCWIYCRMAALATTATVTFKAEGYSVAILAVPAGIVFRWLSVRGHLRCGRGAQDPTTCQITAVCSGATASFEWRYAAITFAPL